MGRLFDLSGPVPQGHTQRVEVFGGRMAGEISVPACKVPGTGVVQQRELL